MDLEELTERAFVVHGLYDELNLRERGRTWTREEFMLGFVGDVGDLAKLAMAAEGARETPGELGHELADCLWAVLVLARLHDVDLAAEFGRMTEDLERTLTARLDSRRG
jgi:NTP pyrophosphatase (non-canonical NTP hydrolase)